VADADGVKTAAKLAKHELATPLAETVATVGLAVAFPAKSHAREFLLAFSYYSLMANDSLVRGSQPES